MELIVGITLMVVAVLIYLAGRSKSKAVWVAAKNGSVAVGGKSSGPITNLNVGAPAPHGTHWLTIVAIIVELVGIAVVLWHAWHFTK